MLLIRFHMKLTSLFLALTFAGCDTVQIKGTAECNCKNGVEVSCEISGQEVRTKKTPIP